jgi:hypothetical protein
MHSFGISVGHSLSIHTDIENKNTIIECANIWSSREKRPTELFFLQWLKGFFEQIINTIQSMRLNIFASKPFSATSFARLEMLLPKLEVDLLALGLLTCVANVSCCNTGSAKVYTDFGPECAF